ncbi:hypothetical protein [Polyangium sp. y55x31]|uniref:hypothetical protein n=1 Tax=Polyangium sp. y55x31 TaxID=3042688 RepID=UPI0024821B89|nr:hypothetical protein [Polyangium sp. y55x31]MDI1481743.1 hypothetical protein [Polyangium sp. y55x31]
MQIARAGDCVLEVEEPDLVIYRLGGVVDGHHLRALRRAEAEWSVGKTYLLALVDISGLVSSTMDARKASTEPGTGTKNRAIAIAGGSRYTQMLVDLTMRAARLLTRSELNVRFFADEVIARDWLSVQRAELVKLD